MRRSRDICECAHDGPWPMGGGIAYQHHVDHVTGCYPKGTDRLIRSMTHNFCTAHQADSVCGALFLTTRQGDQFMDLMHLELFVYAERKLRPIPTTHLDIEVLRARLSGETP